MGFPHYRQMDTMDCGPTCLQIICKYYGKEFNIDFLRKLTQIGKTGVSLLGISKASEAVGFQAVGGNITYEVLEKKAVLPCVIYWNKNHFVVLYKIKKNKVYISDPAIGLVVYSKDEFINNWAFSTVQNRNSGIVLLLNPTPIFYEGEQSAKISSVNISSLFKNLLVYKNLLLQLSAGLLVGSLIQLMLPFLTKSLVDIGIRSGEINVIYLILFGQLFITLGQTAVELVRSWILLHMTTRVSIKILSDFLNKLIRLPLAFFDSKLNSDLLQRIEDHNRIEGLISGEAISTLFSVVTFLAFAFILFSYNYQICFVFLIGSILYFFWVYSFLDRKKTLDFKRFSIQAQNRAKIIQLLDGINEIKLNNSGSQKVWEWEGLQAKLFKFNVQFLTLSQYQQIGMTFINQLKNIFILFLAAKSVINKQMSIGDMMAIQFIIGQMNSPIAQLALLMQTYQNAKISLQRLDQIHILEDEEHPSKNYNSQLPLGRAIILDNVSFTYSGAGNTPVFSNIVFNIPEGKTTAIVGASGSGKTTLLKLLLRIYDPSAGSITVGDVPLHKISPQYWRNHCGTVMQDGFIFSDTIEANITMQGENLNTDRILHALKVSNIYDYIESLPLGLQTKIGEEGKGLSGGQRQRILIARMVYKNPSYIFLDEATSSLDANNESIIMNNLSEFFLGKTVVVVAHRLSTVKNADNIIVLNQGKIVEQGSHEFLTRQMGYYYQLIKNQLELGN